MRVTKVKVGKEMVLMHRKTKKGALVYKDKTNNRDRTSEILPDKKTQSFNLSILNKTIIRKPTGKKRLNKEDEAIYNKLRAIIDALIKDKKCNLTALPKDITKETIQKFLNHKFKQVIKFTNNQGERIDLDLGESIYQAVNGEEKKLDDYKAWKDKYIKTKSDSLKRSIINNKIVIDNSGNDQPLSKRKKVLNKLAEQYIIDGTIKLDDCEQEYKVDGLTQTLAQVDKGEIREDTGTPKNKNDFHRKLKKCLQEHQKQIFGTKEAPTNWENDKLAIYNLEVVKYLERYFPVKTSKRQNTKADIDYYLNTNKGTLKKTVEKQLLNATRNHLLQQGKVKHHQLDESTNSDTLSTIKRNEAFVLNLIDACASAANNIRNIIDPEQDKDILGKGDFITSLNKNQVNTSLFKLFFNADLPSDEGQKQISLWTMRGAVQQIRNIVMHYKQDALQTIFNVCVSEVSRGTICYTDTIYKQCLKKDIDDLPTAIAQKLKTGGALTYYAFADLNTLFEEVPFSLMQASVPFAPGFKKVMQQGIDYQKDKDDKIDFYDLEIKNYTNKEQFEGETYEARYFLLKLIYNNLFLDYFTTNKGAFNKAVNFVLWKNRNHAQKTGKKHAYAFEAIRKMKEHESVKEYMAYVQSQLNLEQNKKKGLEEEKDIHFMKFIKQLFIKGFDEFLNDKKFKFINLPANQLNDTGLKIDKANELNKLEEKIATACRIRLTSIDESKPNHISFYVFCKLLDANYLSKLRNELIKFNTCIDNTTDDYKHLLEIIELCLLNADTLPADYKEIYGEDKERCLQLTKKFIEPAAQIEDWDDLYLQSDKSTPVLHAPIELSKKYGTLALLEKLINQDPNFKIKKDEFEFWKCYQEQIKVDGDESKTQSLIAKKVKQKEKLHKEWEKVHKDRNEVKAFIENKKEGYQNLCIEIDKYNRIDNKLHLVHLKRLHQLTIDILGRMAGFVALWERDFQFMANMQSEHDGNILDFSNGIPKERDFDVEHYKRIFLSNDYRNIRNYIAHFNYLTKPSQRYSLTDLINGLRDMLHYDRKLKNAVSKAFIDLFEKYGMVLEFKFNPTAHKLEVASVKPKKIFHLGTKEGKYEIATEQVSNEYCQLCKTLLGLKN